MIAIIDHGAGNLHSVKKAFDWLGFDAVIVRSARDLLRARRLLLPGVGAFGPALACLRQGGMLESLSRWLEDGKPFLGICLGMQLLFSASEEAPGVSGLGFLAGSCRRFRTGKVPHMGWNKIRYRQTQALDTTSGDNVPFYFVHSYYAVPDDDSVVSATCEYGCEFPAIVRRGACLGVQFHPEKSGRDGLQLLRNWVLSC